MLPQNFFRQFIVEFAVFRRHKLNLIRTDYSTKYPKCQQITIISDKHLEKEKQIII